MTSNNKDERLHFRVSAHQKNVIVRAAEISGLSMTQFMLDSVYQAAAALILDSSERKVSQEKWSLIEAALASPASEIQELKRMSEKYSKLLSAGDKSISPTSTFDTVLRGNLDKPSLSLPAANFISSKMVKKCDMVQGRSSNASNNFAPRSAVA